MLAYYFFSDCWLPDWQDGIETGKMKVGYKEVA